jgi:hypothetical protein
MFTDRADILESKCLSGFGAVNDGWFPDAEPISNVGGCVGFGPSSTACGVLPMKRSRSMARTSGSC